MSFWNRFGSGGLAVGLVFGASVEGALGEGGSYWVYFGTYTGGDSRGIYVSTWDAGQGVIGEPRLVAETENPSFLAVHPDGRHLYAVNETGDFGGEAAGSISAFEVDRVTGGLTFLNRRSSGGAAPCHLVVDLAGRFVLAANYGGGSVISVALEDDGSLGERAGFVQHQGSSVNPRRQTGPHGHSVNLGPDGRFAYVADLGIDRVMIHRFDRDRGGLVPSPPHGVLAPGAGPRHLVFHPSGRHVYVINELHSTITVFAVETGTGGLKEVQTVSTLPPGFEGASFTAEVRVTPDGRYVFGSNRGHDSLAIFRVLEGSGELEWVGVESTRGRTPRNFNVDPTGRFVLAANQGSDSVSVFRIDGGTGRLQAVGEPVAVPKPVCVRFLERRGG